MVGIYDKDLLSYGTVKVGFFGGAGEPGLCGERGRGVSSASLDASRALGAYIPRFGASGNKIIQEISGSPPGNIEALTRAAYKSGSRAIGISPFYDEAHHLREGSPTKGYSVIVYVGSDKKASLDTYEGRRRLNKQFSFRDNLNLQAAHCAIILGGKDGTDEERAIAKMRGMSIGLVASTGGVAEKSAGYMRDICGDTGSIIITDRDPIAVFDQLLALELQKSGEHERTIIDDIIEKTNDIKLELKR
ncbi:MAG TPA: hypothetical protein VFF28_07920 [Candidatus Nanoarchaeia archaeon]|nr:hypothetical protein [Candidatus Nanoarchaeia archaeon]